MKKKGSIEKLFHRWGGLVLCFFLIAFSLSGILLNHREPIASLDLSRSLLPSSYHVDGWTQGAAVGSTALSGDSFCSMEGRAFGLRKMADKTSLA